MPAHDQQAAWRVVGHACLSCRGVTGACCMSNCQGPYTGKAQTVASNQSSMQKNLQPRQPCGRHSWMVRPMTGMLCTDWQGQLCLQRQARELAQVVTGDEGTCWRAGAAPAAQPPAAAGYSQ
jgi:hypothetical protein